MLPNAYVLPENYRPGDLRLAADASADLLRNTVSHAVAMYDNLHESGSIEARDYWWRQIHDALDQLRDRAKPGTRIP